MFRLDSLLDLLGKYKYFAMFSMLLACGLGMPLPEEVVLILSGLAVGWETANFWLASLACVLGILAGDAIIFAMGRYQGRRFFQSRPMRLLLNEKRQMKIHSLFARRGNSAVFFARFIAGLRIGVYAYAGQHGMGWARFLFLDFLGALLSGPTSIWIGAYVARKLVDPDDAVVEAKRLIHEGSYVIYLIIALALLFSLGHWWWSRRGDRRGRGLEQKDRELPAGPPMAVTTASSGPQTHTHDPGARQGEGFQ